jgi:hypothetical protein
VATQRSKPAPKPKRTHVSLSVRVDVPTSARVAAAAALAGLDKSAFCAKAIEAALTGIVVFDRKAAKSAEHVDPSSDEVSSDPE